MSHTARHRHRTQGPPLHSGLLLVLLLATLSGSLFADGLAPPEVCPERLPPPQIRIVPPREPESIIAPAAAPIDLPEPSTIDIQPLPVPEAAPTDDSSTPPIDAASGELKTLLRQLAQQREKLTKSVRSVESGASQSAEGQPPLPPALANIEHELEVAAVRQQQRLRDLNREISRLEDILRQRQAEPAGPPAAATVQSPPGPQPEQLPEPAAAIKRRSPPPQPVQRDLVAVPITDEPVDRVGLADSLFATGQYELALEIYQKLDSNDVPDETKLWIEHQTAACHRQLGNDIEAETYYRRVAGNSADEFLAENAKWWLGVLAQRRDAVGRLDQIQTAVEQIGKQIDE